MPFITLIETTIFIFLGLVLGSFASALIWRIPRNLPWFIEKDETTDKPVVFSRSACPHCNKELKAIDLIPFFSWVFLGGKCRYCKEKIAIDYPLAELLSVLMCLGIYHVWGFTGQGFILCAAVPFLVAMIFIDFRHMILPDTLNIILGSVAVAFIAYQSITFGAAYGYDSILRNKLLGLIGFPMVALLTGAIMTKILKKDSMGFGDVKFFAAAGLWLGILYLPFFLICSGLLGVCIGVVYKLTKKGERFPFGPALIAALYIGVLLQGLEIIPLM